MDDASNDLTNVKAWMPLWIGDYLSDTGRLNTEQHGAYILLLMDYWRSGPPLDDDETLSQITRLPIARWKKHRQTLSTLFNITGGKWRHKQLDECLKKARENRQAAHDRAVAAANARWQNGGNSHA